MASDKQIDTLDGPRAGKHPEACWGCRHWIARGTCAAFPDGIPDDILYNRAGHRVPHPGDNGLQWQAFDTPATPDPEMLERIRTGPV